MRGQDGARPCAQVPMGATCSKASRMRAAGCSSQVVNMGFPPLQLGVLFRAWCILDVAGHWELFTGPALIRH